MPVQEEVDKNRVLLDWERNEAGYQSVIHIIYKQLIIKVVCISGDCHYLNFIKFGFHGHGVLTDREFKTQTFHVKAAQLFWFIFLNKFHILQVSEIHLNE